MIDPFIREIFEKITDNVHGIIIEKLNPIHLFIHLKNTLKFTLKGDRYFFKLYQQLSLYI